MTKTPKFNSIVESLSQRYQLAGILTGEYVTIKKDAFKSDFIKNKPQMFIDKLKQIMENGLPLKASAVSQIRPMSQSTIGGPETEPGCHMVDVVVEYAPGLWRDPMTLPVELIELKDGWYGDSEQWHRKDTTQIKPTEEAPKANDDVLSQTQSKIGDKSLPVKDGGEVKVGAGKKTAKESVDSFADMSVIYESLCKKD